MVQARAHHSAAVRVPRPAGVRSSAFDSPHESGSGGQNRQRSMSGTRQPQPEVAQSLPTDETTPKDEPRYYLRPRETIKRPRIFGIDPPTPQRKKSFPKTKPPPKKSPPPKQTRSVHQLKRLFRGFIGSTGSSEEATGSSDGFEAAPSASASNCNSGVSRSARPHPFPNGHSPFFRGSGNVPPVARKTASSSYAGLNGPLPRGFGFRRSRCQWLKQIAQNGLKRAQEYLSEMQSLDDQASKWEKEVEQEEEEYREVPRPRDDDPMARNTQSPPVLEAMIDLRTVFATAASVTTVESMGMEFPVQDYQLPPEFLKDRIPPENQAEAPPPDPEVPPADPEVPASDPDVSPADPEAPPETPQDPPVIPRISPANSESPPENPQVEPLIPNIPPPVPETMPVISGITSLAENAIPPAIPETPLDNSQIQSPQANFNFSLADLPPPEDTEIPPEDPHVTPPRDEVTSSSEYETPSDGLVIVVSSETSPPSSSSSSGSDIREEGFDMKLLPPDVSAIPSPVFIGIPPPEGFGGGSSPVENMKNSPADFKMQSFDMDTSSPFVLVGSASSSPRNFKNESVKSFDSSSTTPLPSSSEPAVDIGLPSSPANYYTNEVVIPSASTTPGENMYEMLDYEYDDDEVTILNHDGEYQRQEEEDEQGDIKMIPICIQID